MAGRAITAALWLLLGGVASSAQDEETRVFVGRAKLDLDDLMSYWIATKDLNLQFEEGALEGPVKLWTSSGISVESLWAVTNRELIARDLACIQVPGEENLSIVTLERASQLARVESDVASAEAGYVRTLYRVRHVDLAFALSSAAVILSEPEGKATQLKDTGQLLLAGLKPQVLHALEVLEAIDVRGQAPVVYEYTLERANPVAVQTAIEQVLPARGQVAGELKAKVLARPEANALLIIAPPEEVAEIESFIARFDRVQPTVTRAYVTRRFGLDETAKLLEDTIGVHARARGPDAWRAVVDKLTGALIVTAPLDVHGDVEELIEKLNTTPVQSRTTLRTIPVRHRPVNELLGMLEDMLNAGLVPSIASDDGQAGPSQPEGSSGGRPNPVRWQDQLTLSADPHVNRLVAVGERWLLDEIEGLIAELDVHFPQVMIEALVVSLTESQTRDLGVELQNIGTVGDAGVQLASLLGLGSPDPASGLLPPASGAGGVGVVLDPGEFSALVRALEALNEGRTLTVPKVLVNNNEDANLASVLQTPFIATNASDTVATTSFGGTLDAGTTIHVQPQIAEADRLILDYRVSISSFVGESSDPAVPPPRQENTLESVVTIPDGHTVVVGGLEVETLGDGVAQVPLLGSLPVVGGLFRSSSESQSKTRFFVFLRCTVMRGERFEDLKYTSSIALDEAGLDDGWPVLEPLVIR